MSELHVAVVAEGPTDVIVIEAALKALLPAPFVLTQLQPEQSRPKLGAGWGGVLRWCLEFASCSCSRLEDDPTLQGFDLFIIHMDADVAEFRYMDVSTVYDTMANQRGWPLLPCSFQCPPPDASVKWIRKCLLAWSGLNVLGPKTVLCVPSKSPEAWLIGAVFSSGHRLLNSLECKLNLEGQLRALPRVQRVKKTTTQYRTYERQITTAWNTVRQRCSQAERFSRDILAVLK